MGQEQTKLTIDKINFIVTSNFKSDGSNAHDKIKTLMRREVQESTIDKAMKTRYNKAVNAV